MLSNDDYFDKMLEGMMKIGKINNSRSDSEIMKGLEEALARRSLRTKFSDQKDREAEMRAAELDAARVLAEDLDDAITLMYVNRGYNDAPMSKEGVEAITLIIYKMLEGMINDSLR